MKGIFIGLPILFYPKSVFIRVYLWFKKIFKMTHEK